MSSKSLLMTASWPVKTRIAKSQRVTSVRKLRRSDDAPKHHRSKRTTLRQSTRFNATCQLDLEASDLILVIMPADSAQTALERVLAAVGQCLDRQSAESLLRLRGDTEMQGRIEELADKCTEGRLTPEERDEYEAMIRVGNFVAILQAKARRLLAEGHAA
jgi:hypothetical protein